MSRQQETNQHHELTGREVVSGHAHSPSTAGCLDMAAQARQTEHGKLVFWTTPKSSEKDSLVPGVNDLGNMRPRVSGGRTKEIKAVMPVVQSTVEDSQSPRTQSLGSSSVSQHVSDTAVCKQVTTAGIQGVSLKNLCVEDKKRVANLIKELARLGEEKENAEKNLEEERKRYEEQILSLVTQQEQLLKDYEVQKTLVEYQTHILKLQQQKRHPLKLQDHYQQQVLLPVQPIQQSPQKLTNSRDATNKVSYTQNLGQQFRVQGPQTYNPEAREDLCKDMIDQWQRNLCMNTAPEEGVGFDNCSTEVNPSVSLPVKLANTELDLQRPFTAIIDRELAYQRQLLVAAVANSSQECPTVKTLNATEMIEKASLPRTQPELFLQKMVSAGHPVTAMPHRHVDLHQVDLVSQPQNHVVTTGTRHPEYPHLPAEKTEIIARFMQSQTQVLDDGSIQQMTQNYPNCPISVTHQLTLCPPGNCVDTVNEGERLLARKRAHRAPRSKKRKPPPPSYGPLHAPIMSSTQKSSEFGENVSGNSSVRVDRKCAARQDMPRVVDEDVEDKNCVENVHHHHHHHEAVRSRQNNHVTMKHKDGKKTEKHDRESGKHSLADTDRKIVDKYKQLSAIEHKTQLLKQRSLLLEEQAKLKKMLAEQHHQMQMQRQATLAPTQRTTLENPESACIEMSLARLEEEVARKEQELLHERQRLERKRQEYGHQEPGDQPQAAYRAIPSSSHRLTDVQEGSGAGHQPFMSAPGARMEVEAPPHSSDSSGRRQQTRTSNGREVNARHSKDADGQAQKVNLPVGAAHLPGKVKDAEGIRHQSPKVKDIVKKLDYSLNSDTENDEALNAESLQRSTPASRGGVARAQDTHIVPPALSQVSTSIPQTASLPQRSDASTSVSFAHMSRIPTESPSGRLKRSTGTEMTPDKSTDYTRMGHGSKSAHRTLDDERQKLSLVRSDRTYTKDHGFLLPEKEQRGHMSPSLSKVTNQHDASSKTPTSGSRRLSSKHQQNAPVLIDKLHLVEDNYTPLGNPLAKSQPGHADPVLELFEVKRPVRSDTSRQQRPRDVRSDTSRQQRPRDVLNRVNSSGSRIGPVSRQLDTSKGTDGVGSGDNDCNALVNDEMSVEEVIQILNFPSKQYVPTPHRSADTGANVCTEAIVGAVSRSRDASKGTVGAGSSGDDRFALVHDEMSLEEVIEILNFPSREHVSSPHRSAIRSAVSRPLDASKGMDDKFALVDDEISVEEVIEILNFPKREYVSTPHRSADIGANVCTEDIADDNTDVGDEAEDQILEDVFFV